MQNPSLEQHHKTERNMFFSPKENGVFIGRVSAK
jgi:hypothetical protein